MKDSLYMDFDGTRRLRSQMDSMKESIDEVLSQIRTVKNGLVHNGALKLDGDSSVEASLERLEARARKLSSRMDQYSDIVGASVDANSDRADRWADIFRRLNTASGNVIGAAGWAAGNGVKSAVSPDIRCSFAGIAAMGSLLFGSEPGISDAVCLESAGRRSPLFFVKKLARESARYSWTGMTEKQCLAQYITNFRFRMEAESVYDKKGTTGSPVLDQLIAEAKQKERQNRQYLTYIGNGALSAFQIIRDSAEFLCHAATGQWDEALKDAGDVWNDTINTGQDLFCAPIVYYYHTAMGNEEKGLKRANEISGYNGASGYLRAKGYTTAADVMDDASAGYGYIINVKKFVNPKSWTEYVFGFKVPDWTDSYLEFFNDLMSDVDILDDIVEGDNPMESFFAIPKSGKIGKLIKSRDSAFDW